MAWTVEAVGLAALARSRESVRAALPGERDDDDLVALVGADDPFKDHVIRLQVSADGRVVGTAVGHLEGTAAFLDLVAVDPARQRQGIGRALLAGFETAARDLGARTASIGGSVRRFAWPGISMVRTPAIALALRHGYRRSQVLFDMWVDLDATVAPAPASLARLRDRGIACRLATVADLPALRRIAAEIHSDGSAAVDADADVWGDELEAGVRGERSGVHVATAGADIVGFAGFSVYRSSMFGPTGTAATHRGQGVGEVLLRLALEAIRAQGHDHAEIGWIGDAALPFYSATVGATCGAAYWVLTKPLAPAADWPGSVRGTSAP